MVKYTILTIFAFIFKIKFKTIFLLEDYYFTVDNNKIALSHICSETVEVLKEFNVRRHIIQSIKVNLTGKLQEEKLLRILLKFKGKLVIIVYFVIATFPAEDIQNPPPASGSLPDPPSISVGQPGLHQFPTRPWVYKVGDPCSRCSQLAQKCRFNPARHDD